MVQTKDKRLVCSSDKRDKIKATRLATALRRQNQVMKVYEGKIVWKRLNSKQKDELELMFVEGKRFYNHVLELHQSGIALKDINTTGIKSVNHLTKDGKHMTTELRVLNAQQKQGILSRMISNERTICTLVKRGLQKHGNLTFKSELNSIPLKQYGVTYRFVSARKVKVGGISGSLLIRFGDQLQEVDEMANANLVKRADGYYLLVTTFTDKNKFKKQKTNKKEIGLDFGIKTSITTSEGEKIDVSVGEGEQLKKLQRELFRRHKGSKNRMKTIRRIQREYQKLSYLKKDKACKIVSKLKPYKTISMQDEQIAGWHRGLFGRNVQHSCLGTLKARLKALPQTVVLDRWIPTTKFCPKCGQKHDMPLSEREYSCSCGYHEDRDIHSAKNMLEIMHLVFDKLKLPTEHREVTLTEFKTAIGSLPASDKSERGSEKMPRL